MATDIVENILSIAMVGLRFMREVWRWRLRSFVDAIASPLFVYHYLPAHMQICADLYFSFVSKSNDWLD